MKQFRPRTIKTLALSLPRSATPALGIIRPSLRRSLHSLSNYADAVGIIGPTLPYAFGPGRSIARQQPSGTRLTVDSIRNIAIGDISYRRSRRPPQRPADCSRTFYRWKCFRLRARVPRTKNFIAWERGKLVGFGLPADKARPRLAPAKSGRTLATPGRFYVRLRFFIVLSPQSRHKIQARSYTRTPFDRSSLPTDQIVRNVAGCNVFER